MSVHHPPPPCRAAAPTGAAPTGAAPTGAALVGAVAVAVANHAGGAPRRNSGPGAGFTLLELLIAIALFSVVAVLAQGGLQAVLRGHERTEEAVDTLDTLRHTWLLIDQDMAALAARGIRDGSGLLRPAFVLERGRLEFTRRRPGDDLPQRVEYRLLEDRLVRFEWPAGDLAPGAEPLTGVVLEEVEGAELRALINGVWVEAWPLPGFLPASDTLPGAVEVRLSWQGHVLRWLFAVSA